MTEIIPAILTSDPIELKEKLLSLEGIVKRVHIDIIDGNFSNNKTIDPLILEGIETTLKIDFHLMVVEPINWIEKCVRGGGDRVIGHVEKMSDQIEFLGKAQEVGLQVGLGLDLETPIEKIESAIIKDLDVVLVMGVPAGFGGQKFHPEILKKIKGLARIKKDDESPFLICADGGETLDTVDEVVRDGADEIVVGRRLFEGSIEKNIEKFLNAI